MTTKHIQLLIGKQQVLKFHNPVCENVNYLLGDFEQDVISVSKSGMVYEFEVKISRSDFKADAKKRKHIYYPENITQSPNYFSYVCPEGLISPDEINKGVGLYYATEDKLLEIVKPKIRHKNVFDKNKIMDKICKVMSERTFLGCCRMTYINNGIKERNKNRKQL